MAPNVRLTLAVIASVVPPQTLSDLLLGQFDMENDFQLLFQWLRPFYLGPGSYLWEPLVRVKAAAKHCLRDKSQHTQFVRLYLNSVGKAFHVHFVPFLESALLALVIEHVASLYAFYRRQTAVLNLSPLALEMLSRGLIAIFIRHLQAPKFLTALETALRQANGDIPRLWLKALANVGMKPAIQEIVVRISASKIHDHVERTYSGVWHTSVLKELEEWVRVDLYPFFAVGCIDSSASSSNDLVQIAHDELISVRISEIYHIVLHFPRSKFALAELHQCLSLELNPHALHQYRSRLVETFVRECHSHSLHLGSSTVSVTRLYINTIRAFLLVDPTGVLLDKVARPIRKYLKSRSDLVQQLVRGMLDPDPATNPLIELVHELSKGVSPTNAPVDDLTDLHWCPDPIDALPDFKKGKALDVLGALTSIYTLLSVFVEEFTKLFGNRLLQWNKYSTDDILRHVELLKARFGSNEFATLDVMIQDIQESTLISSEVSHGPVSLTILSKIYWPTVADSLSDNDFFIVPIEPDFNNHCQSFEKIKPGREISLIPSLGTVSLELCFENQILEFEVTPAQATVIGIFHDDTDEISLLTVSLATRMSEYASAQALKFWVDKGVLAVAGGKYRAIRG